MDTAGKLDPVQLKGQSIRSATSRIDADSKTLFVVFSDGSVSEALVLDSGLPCALQDGEQVLVSLSPEKDSLPIVLGRVTSYADSIEPKEINLQASDSISLKSGQAEVTIRDNKVLVKGKEVVSRAKGANQIKGGSVSLN